MQTLRRGNGAGKGMSSAHRRSQGQNRNFNKVRGEYTFHSGFSPYERHSAMFTTTTATPHPSREHALAISTCSSAFQTPLKSLTFDQKSFGSSSFNSVLPTFDGATPSESPEGRGRTSSEDEREKQRNQSVKKSRRVLG